MTTATKTEELRKIKIPWDKIPVGPTKFPELTADSREIKKALRDDLRRRTVRVKSVLP